jgi:hypothetical protein
MSSTKEKPGFRDLFIFIFISILPAIAASSRELVSYYYAFLFSNLRFFAVPKRWGQYPDPATRGSADNSPIDSPGGVLRAWFSILIKSPFGRQLADSPA